MLDAIVAIEHLCRGKVLADYSADPHLAAAVERYVERLSEASRHVPEAYKKRHPGIDWRGVADIGNVLRHTYDQVLDGEVWRVVENDLASLKAAVETMMGEVGRLGNRRS